MAIKKNLLWDPSDLNNPQTLFNTKKYYANQDFIYGSDLNLILAPLTHALQFYPLYNDNNTRNVYNTDTSLLTPYNASGQTFEQKPTLFRLTYQGDYNGDVNVIFDNSKSGYNTNVLIDGNYYGKEVRADDVYFKSNNINLSLATFYSNLQGPATDDYSNLKYNVTNRAIFGGENVGYDNSYTNVMNRLIMTHLHYTEVGDDEWETTATEFTLDSSFMTGTLYLKPGTVATMSDLSTLENNIKPSSNGWHNIDDDYQFNTDHSPIKAVFLIEVRNTTETDVHISTVVAIDTTTPQWNVVTGTTGALSSVIIGFGAYTNNARETSSPAPEKDWDAWAKFKYESGVSGKGHYLEFNGNPRTPSSIIYEEYKVTKLFDL